MQNRALKQEAKQCRKEMKKHFAKEKNEKKQLSKEKKKQSQNSNGEVVGHLEVELKSVQKPGTIILKTWKVKNTGETTWGADTCAVFVKGNPDMLVDGYQKVHIGAVDPGHVCYVHCMFQMPMTPGSYTIVYRLVSGLEGKFGKNLRTVIDILSSDNSSSDVESIESAVTFPSAVKSDIPKLIEVEAPEALPVPANVEVDVPVANAPEIPEAQFEYASEIAQLRELGFNLADETLNSVLVVAKGNLAQAIEMLM